jgi:hypothetical protein
VADGWGCGWSIFWRKGVEIRVALRADWGQIPREKSGVAELRRRLFCKEIFNHTLLWPKETTVTVRKLKSLKKRSRSPCHRRVGKSSGSGRELGGSGVLSEAAVVADVENILLILGRLMPFCGQMGWR